jgi:hypothetical protein
MKGHLFTDCEAERFWGKVDKQGNDECWMYSGPFYRKGYGMFHAGGKSFYAHRVAWTLDNSPIPDGLCVCHRCDVRGCVRPDHLFLGTVKDNNIDCYAKGRQPTRKGVGHGRSRLTERGVIVIRQMKEAGMTIQAISDWLGIPYATVGHVVCGITWSHL